jgi:hypothetical protein
MKLTKPNKKYKIKIKQENNKISVYTAIILEEDNTHIKFLDKLNKEFVFSKKQIIEAECLN